MSVRSVIGLVILSFCATRAACQPEGAPLPTAAELARRIASTIPSKGATTAVFRVSHDSMRGQYWLALDWESGAYVHAQGIGFGGKGVDGRLFISKDKASAWEYIDTSENPHLAQMEDRSALGDKIPAFMAIKAISEFPADSHVSRDESGLLVLRSRRPHPNGQPQDIAFKIDEHARVVQFEAGAPEPSYPLRFEYDDEMGREAGAFVLPSRIIWTQAPDDYMIFFRQEMKVQARPDPELFTPQFARQRSSEAMRHVAAVPVNPAEVAVRSEVAPTHQHEAEPPVAERTVGRPARKDNVVGRAIVITGLLLIALAIIAAVRRR